MSDEGFNLGLLTKLGIKEQSFKPGEIIFREGDAAEQMFVIKAGRVEIRLNGRKLDELGEAELFGEMALVDKGPRSATAVAQTDVEVVPVGEKQFLFLVGETPFFALKVMRVLARRLRARNRADG